MNSRHSSTSQQQHIGAHHRPHSHDMGLSQSQPGPGPSSGPTAPPLSSMAGYFLPAPSLLLTHDHPRPASASASIEAALQLRLPPDIVQRILDLAGIWTACRRTNRRALVVQAGGAEPHGWRGIAWSTGQEEELGADLAMGGGGLDDGPGKIWYLVSAPVGCCSEQQAAGREREDWDATDGPEVLGGERAEWLAASRRLRLAGTGDRGEGNGEGEADEGSEDGEVERRLALERVRPSAAPGPGPGPNRPRQQWWLRKVVLETYSRDQGWTVNDDHYGAPQRALISQPR